MGAFCCYGNQTKRQLTIILAILNCSYPRNIFTIASVFSRRCHLKHSFFINLMLPWQPNKSHTASVVFEEMSFKIFFFFNNLMLPRQPNKMVTSHKTHKLDTQSLNDHNCQIGFTSLHWLLRKCNLTVFPL